MRQLDAGQIVDGEIGLLDQVDDRGQPSLVGNRQRGVDPKTKLGQTDDVRKIQILECRVVGDIEKDRLDASRSGQGGLFPRGGSRRRASPGGLPPAA